LLRLQEVSADADLLDQALINLVRNSVEALRDVAIGLANTRRGCDRKFEVLNDFTPRETHLGLDARTPPRVYGIHCDQWSRKQRRCIKFNATKHEY
jgi:signal transduction histidine kinase